MISLQKTRKRKPPPFESQRPPIFCGLYTVREVSSKKPKDFFGVYRYFAGADSEYWHGALKKIVLGWRLACILLPPFPKPCTLWFAADSCILAIRRGWVILLVGRCWRVSGKFGRWRWSMLVECANAPICRGCCVFLFRSSAIVAQSARANERSKPWSMSISYEPKYQVKVPNKQSTKAKYQTKQSSTEFCLLFLKQKARNEKNC